MRGLLELFLELCLFRKGPQDLPASWTLLKLTLSANALVGVLGLLTITGLASALVQTAAGLGLLSGVVYAGLWFYNYPNRFLQTLTALAGADALLGVFALPVLFWTQQMAATGGDASLPVLLFWGLLGWSVAVTVHILHHALATSRGLALAYTLGYLILSWTVLGWLAPARS